MLNAPNSFLKCSDLPKLSDCTCGHDCIKREEGGRVHSSSVKSLLLRCELASAFIIHIVLPKSELWGDFQALLRGIVCVFQMRLFETLIYLRNSQ